MMENEEKNFEAENTETKNNSSKKTQKKIFISGVIILLAAIGVFYFVHNNNTNCGSSFCGLTGKTVDSGNAPLVAEFSGGQITSDELDSDYNLFSFLSGYPKEYLALVYPKDSFLNQTISEDLLYNEAVKQGFDITDANIESSLEKSLANSGMTMDDFKKELLNQSISYDSFISFYKKQFAVTNFLNATLFNNLSVADSEMRDYYNNNPDMFNMSEQIRASHILVNSSELADDIIKKLDSGGNFSELAKEYSLDGSASKGGDLGYFGKGQMVPEFEDAAFALGTVGNYTETPVKTQYGYHIILLTGIKPAGIQTYEDAKDNIKSQILTEKKNNLSSGYINELIKNSNVKIYTENIKEENASGNIATQ